MVVAKLAFEFLLVAFTVRNQQIHIDILATSMLVTDVGDQMC